MYLPHADWLPVYPTLRCPTYEDVACITTRIHDNNVVLPRSRRHLKSIALTRLRSRNSPFQKPMEESFDIHASGKSIPFLKTMTENNNLLSKESLCLYRSILKRFFYLLSFSFQILPSGFEARLLLTV